MASDDSSQESKRQRSSRSYRYIGRLSVEPTRCAPRIRRQLCLEIVALFPRRTLLRGLGCTIALPWLEAFPLSARRECRGATASAFAALFMGNGINSKHWWAKGRARTMELGKSLEPLEPFANAAERHLGSLQQVRHRRRHPPRPDRQHPLGRASRRARCLRGGISVDQVLANRFGEETPQPSLVLGCEQPITGYHETNFSMAYSSHISWQDANSPVPMEVYPSLAFDSLFDNQGSRRTLSILDRVKEQAAAPEPQVSSTDKAKLDEYLTSVREVEKRVEKTRATKDKADEQRRPRPPARDEAAR